MQFNNRLEEIKKRTHWMPSHTCNDNKSCKKCNGTTWVTVRDPKGYEVAKRCECFHSVERNRRIEFADIPPAFKENRLNNFSMEVYNREQSKKDVETTCFVVKRWLRNFEDNCKNGIGLYIYSDAKGSGKTRLASSIGNELIDRNYFVKFCTALDIFSEIKSTWNKNAEYTEKDLIHYLMTRKILILDDFGMERVSDWNEEIIYRIVNYRYIENKTTIYTSNMPIEKLPYGDRIRTRIKEKSIQLHFAEESVRDKIAFANMQGALQES